MRVKIMSATSGDHYRVAQATMDGERRGERVDGGAGEQWERKIQ